MIQGSQEYAALQDGAALADMDQWSVFSLVGPDRKKFLNGLVSNDVARLAPGRGLAACLLTPKGTLRADVLIYDVGDELLILSQPRAGANFADDIKQKIILSQSALNDIRTNFCLFYLGGPHSAQVFQHVFSATAPEQWCVQSVTWHSGAVRALSWPRLGSAGVLLLVPALLAEQLEQSLCVAGAVSVSGQTLDIWRVEQRLPIFGVDMDEKTLPQEARLDDHISYEKGCYMGQETMSRLHHMGHVNRILVGLRCPDLDRPKPGAAVLVAATGEPIGAITSVVDSPRYSAVLALAMIRADQSAAGTPLRVAHGEARVTVYALP